MKVVIAHRDGSPRVVDLPEPPMGDGNVQIRVSHAALFLPEELSLLDGIAARLKPGEDGLPLGMMCSGIVEEVGRDVRTLKAGLRVAAFGAPYVYHAARLSVPANLVVELPKKVNHEEGAFAGQGAYATHLFRMSEARLGETALIFGAGMTGILAAQVAKAAGVSPILVDTVEHRLSKGRNAGVANACLEDEDALSREVTELTGGKGADAAIVTPDAGDNALRLAVRMLRPRGRIVTATANWHAFSAQVFVEKQLELRAVNVAGPGHGDPVFERDGVRYPEGLVRWTLRENMEVFLGLLAERRAQVSPLVGERIPLERAVTLYEKIQRTRQTVLGAVLTV